MEKKKHKFYWEDQDNEEPKAARQIATRPMKIAPIAGNITEQRPKVFSFSVNFPKMNMNQSDISLKQTDKEIIASILLKGFAEDSIKIEVKSNSIRIRAQSRSSVNKGGEGISFSMSSFSVFDKTTSLPSEVEPGKYSARFDNGVLTVTMPKKKKIGFRLFGRRD